MKEPCWPSVGPQAQVLEFISIKKWGIVFTFKFIIALCVVFCALTKVGGDSSVKNLIHEITVIQ